MARSRIGSGSVPSGSVAHRRWVAAAAAILALTGGSLAACTGRGSRPAADGAAASRVGPTSTTADTPRASRPSTTSTTVDESGPPVEGPTPDPTVDDVPDATFAALGDPRIDVHHYDLTVRADPGNPEISGTAVLTLAARTTAALPSFTLDLRGPRVTSAKVGGRPAQVSSTGAEVTITPATPLTPRRAVEVTVAYTGVPAPELLPALKARIGWQADDQGGWFTMSEPDGTSTWAPVNDHPSDKATWTITLDTPDGITGVSNGRLVSRDVAGGRRRWVWQQDRPMASYLALAAVGRYDLVEHVGPTGIHVAMAFPSTLPAAGRASFWLLDEILQFYADTFGPYPDDDAGVIVAPADLGVALETQTRPLFGLDGVDVGYAHALAHELAHQWFGDAVTPRDWTDLWLNEGFATYADYLWREHHDGADLRGMLEDRGSALYGSDLPVLSTAAASTFDPSVYGGGARTLHALRLAVGDQHFFEIVRRWVQDHHGGTATTDDLVALASKVAGQDVHGLFDTWLHSPGQPALPS